MTIEILLYWVGPVHDLSPLSVAAAVPDPFWSQQTCFARVQPDQSATPQFVLFIIRVTSDPLSIVSYV